MVFLCVFYIVSKGVKNGIEKLNVWMMPSLFILLILMLVYAISKDGFIMAVKFLFVPDFSKINTSNVLEALGLAFLVFLWALERLLLILLVCLIKLILLPVL